MIKLLRLTKIKSNHDNLAHSIYEGTTAHLPEVGESFVMTWWPLEAVRRLGNCQTLSTTDVREVKELSANKIVFTTKNSIYEIEILPEESQNEPSPECEDEQK